LLLLLMLGRRLQFLLLRRALLVLLCLVRHLVDYLLMEVMDVLQSLLRLGAPLYPVQDVAGYSLDRL